MIILTASKSCLTASRRELLVEGAVNVNIVQFVFSSDWDGLTKTAVFQAGSDKYSVLLDESNEAPIPWEVLQNPRRTLYAGVYGTNGESLVLPTIWANCGEIKPGVTQGENTQPPTPDVYSQILQVAKDAEDVAQSVRDDADSGKFNGEQGPTGPQGYTYTPAVSEEGVISWTNDGSLPNPSPVNIKGPQGKQGIQGVQGKQGERGYVYTPNVSQDGIISWTNDGDLENPDPVDIRGPEGPQGGQGEQGIQGPRGYTYTPRVGEDGTVSWTNDGNLPNPDPVNITGPQGETGETPDITAGTVETLEPGQDATAEITGETPNLVLNLGIPKGQPGQDAPQIDDDVVSATNPWSSLKIVDTLAPPFSSSGAIVTCNPVAGYPLHVVSQIMLVQAGNGDPSPDNVRPIRGWTEANLWVSGANLFDPGKAVYNTNYWSYDSEKNEWKSERTQATYIYVELNLKPRTYLLTAQITELSGDSARILVRDSNNDTVVQKLFNSVGDASLEWTCEVEGTYRICAGGNSTGKVYIKDIMFSIGSDSPAYEPYQGRTITLPFGQTVYGGEVDWTTGVLTVTMAEIASYNREILPGAWMSDRDVYNPGTTPTIGAKVVYELPEPQSIQLTPQEILALSGVNTIYTDTGDTTVSGRADPNTILQQLAQRIAALEGQAING